MKRLHTNSREAKQHSIACTAAQEYCTRAAVPLSEQHVRPGSTAVERHKKKKKKKKKKKQTKRTNRKKRRKKKKKKKKKENWKNWKNWKN